MSQRHWINCAILMFLLGAVTWASGQSCRLTISMMNASRHVVGEVNAECAPTWHTVTWGNWGVSSNFSGLQDGNQFRGWKIGGNHAEWNSCTRDHIRDTDTIYYNHDHNGNGLGDDQWGHTPPYGDSAYIYTGLETDIGTDCPRDTDYDGQCDTGGCLTLSSGFGVGGQFLSLYELDWDGDDFVTTLYIDSGCCSVTPTCTWDWCEETYSSWYPTAYWTDTEVTASVSMKFWYAYFVDQSGVCEQLRYQDPQYNCY